MCNVIHYYFACTHSLRRRRSHCSGTKHKITRTRTKAACTAESFLTVYVRTDCGSCQLGQWEQAWVLKLQRAKSFRDKLRDTSLPAYEEIADLVKELETEYTRASWDTRHLFVPVAKCPVARVFPSHYTKARSPLAQEVLPEDVLERARCKEWADMDESDYEGDYIASTDPIHPVSTDYSHPSDDDDGSWILQHLADGEEDDAGGINGMIDFEGASWNWGNVVLTTSFPPITGDPNEDTNGAIPQEQPTEDDGTRQVLTTWGPDAAPSCSSFTMDIRRPGEDEQLRYEPVADVVSSFWSVVNGNHQNPLTTPGPELPKISDDDSPSIRMHALSISPTFQIPTELMTPPPSAPPSPNKHPPTPRLSTNAPSDTPPPSPSTPSPHPTRQPLPPQTRPPFPQANLPPPSPPLLRPRTPTSPNSTRAVYDRYRTVLRSRRCDDVRKFHRDWLTVSRCEARAFEGCAGRQICDPPVPRDGAKLQAGRGGV